MQLASHVKLPEGVGSGGMGMGGGWGGDEWAVDSGHKQMKREREFLLKRQSSQLHVVGPSPLQR